MKTVLHERYILTRPNFMKAKFFNYPNWGEKNIYTQKYIFNIFTKKLHEGMTIVDYCNLWNTTFGMKRSRIVHIVRHPYDVLNSAMRKRSRRLRRDMTKGEVEKFIDNYTKIVPGYTREIMELPNSISIKFENLLADKSNMIKKLFNFCKLSLTNDPEVARKDRLFAHKKEKSSYPNMPEVFETMNIVEGIRYGC